MDVEDREVWSDGVFASLDFHDYNAFEALVALSQLLESLDQLFHSIGCIHKARSCMWAAMGVCMLFFTGGEREATILWGL